MDNTIPPQQQPTGTVPCPACGTLNSSQAVACQRCGAPLGGANDPMWAMGGRTAPIGGRTGIIPPRQSSGSGGRAHLVAPKDIDLGSLRGGETSRGKLRIANNGSTLLTGTARTSADAPWLRILGSGAVYCAAGAVEALDVQVNTHDLRPGRHIGAVLLETDGGQASVQVTVTVFRDSLLPAITAAIITLIAVLGIAGLVYASNGNRLPFVAPAATVTSTFSPTPRPTVTPRDTSTPEPTATTVDVKATATAEAQQALQAQQLVAHAHATATALTESLNATATAVAANQAPDATNQRLAIQAAVNRFLLVRAKALNTGNGSNLASVATGQELVQLRAALAELAAEGAHTQIVSIEQPVWDSVYLHGNNSADATLSKHEDELTIRNSTGLADDVDPSYKGKPHTLRNQHFGVTYNMVLVKGQWLVAGNTVYDSGTPQPTKQPDLLPPPGEGPVTAEGTTTPVPTAAPATGDLSIEQVVNQALPSVLRVTGNIANNQQSTGTGFVVQTSGNFAYVVTNDHVVNGATDIVLSTQTSGPLPAVSVQEDTADDLAVIKIAQPAQPLPALNWGDSESVRLGENVVAIGFALGLQGEPTISSGIISALHRDVGQRWLYLQHTAPINHGNSGGPLLDQQGAVIGINTLLDENAQSVYFAIPAAKAQTKVADLIGAMP